jgi:phage terminase large subunit-like protein
MAAVIWINEQLHVGCAVYSGEDGVLQARDLIEDLAERYSISEVAFDPWRAAQIAQELQQRGVRCSAFPQTDARMIPASKGLHGAIIERRRVLLADQTLGDHRTPACASG